MKLTPLLDPSKNYLLLNTIYVPPAYEIDDAGKRKKIANDYLYLVYRDRDTKEKRMLPIEDPLTDTFITKEEYRNAFRTQRRYLEEEKVDRYQVPYSRLTNFVANKIKEDGKDINYLQVVAKAPKESFKWRHTYFADYNICDYAMISYLTNSQTYIDNRDVGDTSISRAFLDIEADVYGLTSGEMDEGKGPINAVSVVVPYDNFGNVYDNPKVYTFLLRNYDRYKQQEYFENNLDKFIGECHGEFDEKYGSPEFIINIYDSERELLRNLFRMLHSKSPDFILIWNMSYDVPKMISRLTYLGEEPRYYFCHKDFKRHACQYNYDNIFKNDFNKLESLCSNT